MVDLAWTPWAIPGLLAGLVTGSLAAFVLWARPERTQNRRLSLQLFVEAVVIAALHGAAWLFADPDVVSALTALGIVLVWFKLWTYYNFLATLPTPLARRLERPPIRWGLLVAVLALAGTWFVRPEFYVSGVRPASFAPYAAVPGAGWSLVLLLWAGVWLVSLVFAVDAVRRAPTELLRRQAKGYLASFGFRDVGFAVFAVLLVAIPQTDPTWLYLYVGLAGIWIVYPLMVGYAILRTQLFEIDLQVKRTIEGSTVAAVFGVVFVGVAEGVELVLGLDGTLYGFLAAVTVGVGFRQVEAGAERVADRLMPGVEDTEAYRQERKREVYRASLEELHADGEVTDKERRMLGRLQEELGLGGDEAARLEADVLEAGGDGP